MATTYGERLLADVEERDRRKRLLRRRVLVFGPAALAVFFATMRTVGIRNAGLADEGIVRSALDAGAVVAYGLAFVLVPLYASFAQRLNAVTASVALVAGPIAMPIVFGPGWRWWQQAIVVVACSLVIAARSSQSRQRGRRRRSPRR